MAIIDRFCATCNLTSPLRRLNQIKMVPIMIFIAIIISCLASIYNPILFYFEQGIGCTSTQPTISSILYIILSGVSQPIVMLIFVLLTYRNIRRSRQRIGDTNGRQFRNQFVVMLLAQVFTTCFISLQWIIPYFYNFSTANESRTMEQNTIMIFVLFLTANCYHLNNVKAFYISILTSKSFRKTFIKGVIGLSSRLTRGRFGVTQTNTVQLTESKFRRQNQSKI